MFNPLEVRSEGLYCKSGDFYIDAWEPVKQCVVTHAHSDHARFGHQLYWSTEETADIILKRFGQDIAIKKLPYNQKIKLNDCWVSFHPAGHILGSSQIKIEYKNTICVVSGDYKRAKDPTCEPFQLQECDIFVTESTFGLPIYNWEQPEVIVNNIVKWWQENKLQGYASVIFCYALGKAQRLLAMLQTYVKEPIFVHGSILSVSEIYKMKDIPLGDYLAISEKPEGKFAGKLILAPPSVKGSPWMKRFLPYRTN